MSNAVRVIPKRLTAVSTTTAATAGSVSAACTSAASSVTSGASTPPMPSVAATAIFLFVIQWNDLLYPLLFIQTPEKRTLPLALLDFQGEFLTNYPLLFTGVVVSSAASSASSSWSMASRRVRCG